MNFKVNRKTIKGFIIGSILSGLIFSGIGVIAVTITADQIKYTPSNGDSNVSNAKEALDEIYEKVSNNSFGLFGEFTQGYLDDTYDVTALSDLEVGSYYEFLAYHSSVNAEIVSITGGENLGSIHTQNNPRVILLNFKALSEDVNINWYNKGYVYWTLRKIK